MRQASRLVGLFLMGFALCAAFAAHGLGQTRLKLATTTSTENSGLLRVILPPFESRFGMKVDVIAVGTGRALELGKRGDVDVVMVHAPAREEAFVRNGYGVNRRQLMHNYFLLIGPPTDPAQAKAASDVKEALKRIARRQAVFVSRGDDSGTHIKERSLWEVAGVQPSGSWYKEAGAGMGTVLTMSSEMGGYTLTDSGTFLSMKAKLQLAEIIEQDPSLLNPYGIIPVNPARYPHVRYIESMMLIGYLTSPEGQKSIRDFQPTGKILFWPDAIPQD